MSWRPEDSRTTERWFCAGKPTTARQDPATWKPDMIDDNEHPFLDPPWRRVVLVAVCLTWAAVEFSTGAPGWGTVALAFTGYAYWRFIHVYEAGKTGNPSSKTDGEKH